MMDYLINFGKGNVGQILMIIGEVILINLDYFWCCNFGSILIKLIFGVVILEIFQCNNIGYFL